MLNCQGVKQGTSVIWGTSDCSPCGVPYARGAGKHFIEPLSRMWINSPLLHKRLLSRADKGFIIIIALARIMIINDTCVDFVYKIPSLQLKQAAICSFPCLLVSSWAENLPFVFKINTCQTFLLAPQGQEKGRKKKCLKDLNRKRSWWRINDASYLLGQKLQPLFCLSLVSLLHSQTKHP